MHGDVAQKMRQQLAKIERCVHQHTKPHLNLESHSKNNLCMNWVSKEHEEWKVTRRRNELCMNIKDQKKWEEWEVMGKINELCMSLNIKKNERQQ